MSIFEYQPLTNAGTLTAEPSTIPSYATTATGESSYVHYHGDSHHDADPNEHFNAYTDAYTNSNSVSSIAYTDAKAWTDTAAAPNSATAPVIATLAARLKQLLERGAAARTNYNSTQTATLRIGNAHANFRKKLYVS